MEKIILPENSLDILKDRKNLLAFSGGIDSSALFYILIENGIDFDLATVNYGLRAESIDEIAYAKNLSNSYKKELFLLNSRESSFSEKSGRDIRYNFFEKIISKNRYQNLITAHQLNDRLEWFFMQFGKGAGVVELLGFNEIENRENYKIVRPLLNLSKSELEQYLIRNSRKYFIDSSNSSDIYSRNRVRKNYSDSFLNEFRSGVEKSFQYLQRDSRELIEEVEINKREKLYRFKRSNSRTDIFYIDKILKSEGYMLSSKQRAEILEKREVVIAGEWAISIADREVYIAPAIKITMDKKFKEICRKDRVPKLIRPYLFSIEV